MITYLDGKLPLIMVIWAFPVVFMIHDLEEILTIEQFAQNHSGMVLRRFTKLIPTTGQFTISVMLLFLLSIIASYLATRMPQPSWDIEFYAFSISVLFFNVFTHLGQTIRLRRYSPGVITAVLIALPYTLYVFHRLLLDGVIGGTDLLWAVTGGIVLFVPITVIALMLGKVLGRLLRV